tara:strand:+ start:144 stop:323 length:180 start_codon:yes stop_codon:yes gene_type:complete
MAASTTEVVTFAAIFAVPTVMPIAVLAMVSATVIIVQPLDKIMLRANKLYANNFIKDSP